MYIVEWTNQEGSLQQRAFDNLEDAQRAAALGVDPADIIAKEE